VLSARRPRFVLADEVGLGKTIEAGMIFSALRLAGLANRVLVVSPSHLTVQWLAELFHKFNQLFTLMDSDRYASSLKELPEKSPWARFDKVVTSLELLSRTGEYLKEAADPSAAWDLVIIDEAHHLKSELAFEAAKKLSQNSWGLLLLTATPMQLDPSEYHGLLKLIDPATAPTLEGLQERLKRQEEVSTAVRALLEGKNAASAVASLVKRFKSDEQLPRLAEDSGALLSHLAETYSLSERLIRNRRAVVGGFAERRLHRHPVKLSDAEVKSREAAVREKGNVRGAALSQLLRRLESSTAAFVRAAQGSKGLAKLKDELPNVDRDAKLVAFLEVLKGIWAKENRARRWTCSRRSYCASGSSRWPTTETCRWWTATGRWRASGTRTGPRC
jgi:ATP-dependent helicase HepA